MLVAEPLQLIFLLETVPRVDFFDFYRSILYMVIETFPNPNPERDYTIQHIQEEFTSTCPMTGHPDYAQVVFSYAPADCCIELKAMKLYLHSYRNKGIFFEAATNKIFEDFYATVQPKWVRLETIWKGRGGIRSNVVVEAQVDGYAGPKTVLMVR